MIFSFFEARTEALAVDLKGHGTVLSVCPEIWHDQDRLDETHCAATLGQTKPLQGAIDMGLIFLIQMAVQ
ncbi:MAG TPA: hypothetical protein PLE48_12715 [Thiobacillus sp.]|nr:MAG: hypothetical protein B7Y50_05560 [Hydrogenophilales bacterium 28-61-11]OYZ57945.1 MAG: hypothetical protein B7Y21_05330 [Hydrogenophilales bacterium 16-61-112]OZA47459.1 MAG: hypothetical protein B7X81_05330 [Hydrogenophilales bacterium 17-61-76]HQT32251.1 hypothetical protein [Thiobacillus sp.]HQT71272.1 hypothetical protein [Thiobacillus sp.]